jgi:GNAT superfamily N-acetyltransferase
MESLPGLLLNARDGIPARAIAEQGIPSLEVAAMIIQVASKADIERFIAFPHALYAGDAHYAPQPNFLMRKLLSPRHNPFFQHAEAAYFLALGKEGQVLGRVAAIHNRAHLEAYQDGRGFFGFFDAINDTTVAKALLDAAADWLRARGLSRIAGPENFTTNASVGVLTEGFDRPPVVLMPYNHPYYARLLENYGLNPWLDLYSYYCEHAALPVDLYAKAAVLEARLQQRGISLRPINFKHYDADIAGLREAYNAANEGSWGFLPLSEAEFRHMAADLRQLVVAENVWLAEREGRVIAYALAVPDYNQAFIKMPRGRLLPWGWWQLLTAKRRISGLRIMILGVLPQFRRLGIDWLLYARIAGHARRNGFAWGEACYVMDTNGPMKKMMAALGGRAIKQYRVYEGGLLGGTRQGF